MRKLFLITAVGFAIIISCKKEKSCEVCANAGIDAQSNHPPVANAGPDQAITLADDLVYLDGGQSTDPDNNITGYSWRKISGPSSFAIGSSNSMQTLLSNLVEGLYLIELKVTDATGLSDKDTVQIEVRPQESQQSLLGNVFFYCPDPTGTMPQPDPMTGAPYIWVYFDNGYGNLTTLITVKIENLSGILAGVWCKNGCSPRCPVETDYNSELGNCISFNLPPGMYTWSAETTIFESFDYPEVSTEFKQFLRSPHKVQGTVTVLPGDKCIIQPIIF